MSKRDTLPIRLQDPNPRRAFLGTSVALGAGVLGNAVLSACSRGEGTAGVAEVGSGAATQSEVTSERWSAIVFGASSPKTMWRTVMIEKAITKAIPWALT